MALKSHGNALHEGYRLLWYRFGQVLGQGGFGITYQAVDTNLEKTVAIKEYLPKEYAVREQRATVRPLTEDRAELFKWGLERFIQEARTLAKFKHPNIVQVFNVFEENGTAYMVMEYEEGEPLDSLFKMGRLESEADLLRIALPLLDGLEHMHEMGFIHRDIKPPNIYVRLDGSPVLLDFGSARFTIGGETQTLTSIVSPGFAPYEQYHNESGKQGPWTDIYGLGATLYSGLNRGRGPMDAIVRGNARIEGKPDPMVSASELGEDKYSPEFLNAIDAALAFTGPDRPQTIAEWRGMFPDGETQPSHETRKRTPPKSEAVTQVAPDIRDLPVGEKKTPAAWIGLAAMLLVAIGAGLWWWNQEPLKQGAPAPSVVAKAPIAVPPEPVDTLIRKVQELLAEGKNYFEQDKLTGDGEDNALLSELGIEMVDIPGGTFRMGDINGVGFSDEKPVHTVSIRSFRMSKHEVTFNAWDACVAARGCSYRPNDVNWGRGNRPVINVAWGDAKEFVTWLNRETRDGYRLPTEAEWEYAARAGTKTEYPWGNVASHEYANYGTDKCCAGRAEGRDRWVNTSPVGAFPPNGFGLYDMHGNVWEWIEDCWHDNYPGAPADGSAWASGGDCGRRVVRGGSWLYKPAKIRSANRYKFGTAFRNNNYGFRLSQDR